MIGDIDAFRDICTELKLFGSGRGKVHLLIEQLKEGFFIVNFLSTAIAVE